MFHGKPQLKSTSLHRSAICSIAFITMALISVGCSGVSSSYKVAASGTTLASQTSTSSTSSTLSTGTSSTGASTGAGSPYTFTVRGVGYTSTTVSVSAGQVLKLKYAPGVQDTAISGTGVYPQYSRMGVYVQVGSMTQPTEMLGNGYDGTTAQTSSVLDFSSALSGCSGSSTCRQQVTITVTKPNNDFYCLNYGYYCPWNQVLNGQPWNGTLTVQTDDTDSI